jgi:hypothetical protein
MIPKDRITKFQLAVGREDGTTWVDLTGYMSSARVTLGSVDKVGTASSGVDGVARTASFILRTEGSLQPSWAGSISAPGTRVLPAVLGDGQGSAAQLINALFGTTNQYARNSFSPLDRYSSWNQFQGSYSPLLASRREISLQVQIDNGPWVSLFHGLMGDKFSFNGSQVAIEARDTGKLLQDTYIRMNPATKKPYQYGSTAGTQVETVMQAVLDDHLNYLLPVGSKISLHCPVSPGFQVLPYQLEYKSIWDALQELASKFGWWLGFRRDPADNIFKLWLMEPPRGKDLNTADWHLTGSEIYLKELEVSDIQIRNMVQIAFTDAATGQKVVLEPADYPELRDQKSIDEFGQRIMGIECQNTRLIDTQAEALIFGAAAVADLKNYAGNTRMELPLFPELDVFHGVGVTDPRLHSNEIFVGIFSVEHNIEVAEDAIRCRTTAVGSNRVVGAHRKWLRMQTRPGSPGNPSDPPNSNAKIPAPVLNPVTNVGLEVVEQTTMAWANITWVRPTGYYPDHYILQVKQANSSWGNSTEWSIRDSEAQKVMLPAGQAYEARVAAVSNARVTGDWSNTQQVTMPKDSEAPAKPSGLKASPIMGGISLEFDQPLAADWAFSSVHCTNGWWCRWWRKDSGSYLMVSDETGADAEEYRPSLDIIGYDIKGQTQNINGRIEGCLVPSYAEAYTLEILAEGGIRVYFNGELAVDQWANVAVNTFTWTTPVLEVGRPYQVTIEHCVGTGNERLRLQWNSASLAITPTPAQAFLTAGRWNHVDITSKLPAGGIYTLVVRHYDTSGNVSQASDLMTCAAGSILDAPKDLAFTGSLIGPGGLVLYSAAEGDESYLFSAENKFRDYAGNNFVIQAGDYFTALPTVAATAVKTYQWNDPRVGYWGDWTNGATPLGAWYHLFQGVQWGDGTFDASAFPDYFTITWRQWGTTSPSVDATVYIDSWVTDPKPAVRIYLSQFNPTVGEWVPVDEYQGVKRSLGGSLGITGLQDGERYQLKCYKSSYADPGANKDKAFRIKVNSITVSETVENGLEVAAVNGVEACIRGKWRVLGGQRVSVPNPAAGFWWYRVYVEKSSNGTYSLRVDGPQAQMKAWPLDEFWSYGDNRVELGRFSWDTSSGGITIDITWATTNPLARWAGHQNVAVYAP